MRWAGLLLLATASAACSGMVEDDPNPALDAAADAGTLDARPGDGGSTDLGATDASPIDATADASLADAGEVDGATSDAAPVDPGEPDAGGVEIVVAVGYGGRRVMSRDGVVWEHFLELTPNGGDDNDLFRGLGYGNGTFVAVGGSMNAYTMTSTDGYTWAHENRTPRAWLGSVAALGDDFVAAGGNGLRLRSLDRGQSWQDDAGYQPIHYRDLASGGGVVVAVGHNYDSTPNVGVIASTPDGVNWTQHIHAGTSYNRVAFGNGHFVASGPSGRVSHSPDGASWTDLTLSGSGGATVIYTDGDFLLSFNDAHYRSSDGSNWTPASATRAVEGYFAGHYLSLDWPARIWVSTDLSQWSPAFAPLGSGFTKIVRGRVPGP